MTDKQQNSEEPEELHGVVTRVVFRNDDTGYAVLSVKPVTRNDEVTVVGTCAAVWVGENIKAHGRWLHHKKHGHQFQASLIACVAPVSSEGILAYLSSGSIKGLGPVIAERLVKAFGDDTLRVIDQESNRLLDVPGIGQKTRTKIKESWNAQKAIRDIMIFLRSHGVGTAHAARIYRQYGDDAAAIVTADPYRLCRDVWGIGFKSADKIAMSVGIPADSDIRARAGVYYALETMSDDGHCFCPWDVLLEEAQSLLGIASDILNRAIAHGVEHGMLVEDGGNVYLASLHQAEAGIAEKMRELVTSAERFRSIEAEKAVPWAEKRMKIRFDPSQADALTMALTHKVSIITGGPGVGKTTIVRALVDVFHTRKLIVSLTAPTGRAAKRLSEATGAEAQTMHRLLKFQPATGQFNHGPGNLLPGDVFILDEVSMIDISLMHCFLCALAPGSHLILVGDSDQIPSVGPGNVLKDMISSGAVACKRLDMIFRQSAMSWIVRNAHRVNSGESLEFPPDKSEGDFFFIRSDEPDDVIKRMLELVAKRIPERFKLNAGTDIQVLTPMRRNQLGSENLNAILQEALNPTGVSLQKFGRTYRLGDRVMQIRNNYDKEVFNGDIGIITGIDASEDVLAVNFDGREISYKSQDLDELVLAYACSIHKSQGCEYPAVVILMATQHFKLLQRNLLYTAITRGKKLVCLIGSNKAVYMAIRNNKTLLRRSSLARRLAVIRPVGTEAAAGERRLEQDPFSTPI